MSKTVMHLFDVDGTLFDTFEKNRLSFLEADLPFEYTKWHYQHNAKSWPVPTGCDLASVRARKVQCEHKYMKYVTPLPFFETYKSVKNQFCLTGASSNAVALLESKFDVKLPCPYGYGLSSYEKFDVLEHVILTTDEVHYYDDDEDFLKKVSWFLPKITVHRSLP